MYHSKTPESSGVHFYRKKVSTFCWDLYFLFISATCVVSSAISFHLPSDSIPTAASSDSPLSSTCVSDFGLPFHGCPLPFCFLPPPFPLSFVRFSFGFWLLSLCFFLSLLPVSASQWLLQCSSSAFASYVFPASSYLISHVFVYGSGTRTYCLFLFTLPWFAPTAVPQVLTLSFRFPYFPLHFRFLSSASVLLPATQPSVSPFLFFLFLPHSGCLSARFLLSLLSFSPFSLAWFLMHSFPVLILGSLMVSFHSTLLRSRSCSTGDSLLDCSSGTNTWLPLSFVRFRFSIALLSLLFLPFRIFLFLPHSGCLSARFLLSLLSFSPLSLAWFLMHSFPVLVLGSLSVSFRSSLFRSRSCSTGDSLSGLLLGFRFLSSTSALAPHYSAFCFSLSDFLFLPHSGLSSCRIRSHFYASPFFPAWFLVHSSLVLILGSLFVSFRPSLFRSHSRSTSACLLLSLSTFPLLFQLSFVRFFSGSDYLVSVSSVPFFLDLPHSGFPSVRLDFRLIAFPFLLDLISHVLLPGSCTWLSVRFLSFFPASLPQLFHRCFPLILIRARTWLPFSFVHFRFST